MGFRLILIVFIAAFAVTVAELSSSVAASNSSGDLDGVGTCNGKIGDCIDDDEEMQMDSDVNRRVLARKTNYISYNALAKNNVPCNRRGQSYYNCGKSKKANPYNRGCTAATRCARRGTFG